MQHMAKHRTPGLSNDLMTTGKHVLLIRDPVSSLVSCDVTPYNLKALVFHVRKSFYMLSSIRLHLPLNPAIS